MSITLRGKVIHGQKRGKSLGYPTINLRQHKYYEEGIYRSRTSINKQLYKSITFIGIAKTFNAKKSYIETYILDFNNQIYGQFATIKLLSKIRDNQKFNSAEELINQIKKDVLEAWP